MRPILYVDDRSPPVRSVLVLIEELNLDVELVHVDLFNREHLEPAYLKISPMHTVPALTHDDLILNDSQSILLYLTDTIKTGTDLLPNEPALRAKIIDRLFFNATILFRRDSEAFTEIFMKRTKDMSHHLSKLSEIYQFMESFLSEHRFMAGNHVTIADIAIFTTLTTVNMILPVTKDKWPMLTDWLHALGERPACVKGNTPGLTRLREIVKSVALCDIY